jgi:hypothetical protein
MNRPVRRVAGVALILGSLLIGGLPALAQQPATDDDGLPPVPDPGIQARGPVHEAFAQPSEMMAGPGPVIPRRPPNPVPEVPAEQKPEGDVIWIPGYWAWDGERGEFLWVSGVWRLPPPNRRWMPGAWSAVKGGWQWSPGFWAPQGADVPADLLPPPDSLDNGPSSPAPDDNSFYIPGTWLYRSQGYVWRPGCWAPFQPGWTWTPACYSWTPSGAVFVDGYWDYPLESRGLLFAPVCFTQPLWQTPGWCYQPAYCVTPEALISSLFVGPGGRGFWFGDYYGGAWRSAGFRPWFSARAAGSLFSYYRWWNRGNPGWARGLEAVFHGRG